MRPFACLAATMTLCGIGCFHPGTGPSALFSKSSQTNSDPSLPAPKAQELPGKNTAALFITMAETMEKDGKGGKDREAIAYFERARELDPGLNDRASRHLAVLYDRTDNQDKAMHEFQELIKKRPKDAALLNDLGYSYYNRAKWPEAETQLRKAVSIDKQFKPAWVNLGLTLAQQDRPAEAIEAFGHAISPAEAYANLGFVFMVRGKKPEALEAYRRALEMEPALKIAQAAIHRLENGEPVADRAPAPLPAGVQ